MVRRLTLFIAALSLAAALAPSAAPARAADAVVGTGTAASCTEAAFDAALATALGGPSGTITFSCGGPAIITFSAAKTIRGPGFVPPARSVTVDGGGLITLSGGDAVTLFYIEGDANPQALTLRRITLTDGFGSFPAGGGAIFNNGGTLTLDQATIQFSGSTSNGGAILSIGNSTLQISGSTLRLNAAVNGGAIWSDGSVQISDSLLRENGASRGGGAIASAGELDVRASQIISNTATFNGAGIDSTGVLTLTASLVSGNRSTSGGGGGITSRGSLTVDASTISANRSDIYGGGIESRGPLAIGRSTISQNRSGNQGGGIYSRFAATIVNSTISGNQSGASGGGLFIQSNQLTTLRYVTLSGNTGTSGAAILRLLDPTAPLTLEGVVFDAGPTGANCTTVALTPTPDIFSVSYSLSSDSSCFNSSGTNLVANPRLGSLADHGGPTLTQLPLPGSPLLDNGPCVDGVAADQRGRPRQSGAACDIGAVERQPDEGALRVFLPLASR